MKQEYIDLLEKLIVDIGDLHEKTPWQKIDQDWWFDMIDLRTVARHKLELNRGRERAEVVILDRRREA